MMASSSNKAAMRGLTVFITDIRNCPNKEAEEKRVNKEMAKIRKKFKEANGIEGYDRRKYVCKLLYMYMLGYEIDFGYMEAVALLSSNKYQEKLVGYLALTLLLHENHEMLPLIVQSLQNDLQSRNEFHVTLALTSIANIGGKEMSESLAPIVQKILISKASRPAVKKKASLTLLRLYRKYPELLTADVWAEKISNLLDESDQGLLTSVMSLLLGVSTENPNGYGVVVRKVIDILTKIVVNRDYTKDYVYYNIANPWLQVKLLRFLSKYERPDDKNTRSKLYDILKKILSTADEAKGQTVNHKNALNAVLFEAIDLVISLDDDRDLIRQATALLGKYISAKEHSNIRYLALEAMGHIATLDSETAGLVKKYQETVIQALRDPDISIRKRALDLLYGMCDKNNCRAIVTELLSYLATADFAIRDELVLKIAILAEKFAAQLYSWYVDVVLQLITLAGDCVTDDIWFRVVQIVTNHEDIQEYAAKMALQALTGQNVHETAVKVGGYILGEFGHLIADQSGSSPSEQFEALHTNFAAVSIQTKGLLLSAYAKFVNLYPELAAKIRPIFSTYQTSLDAEIQQRSFEYLRLSSANEQLMQAVWDVMPAFPEKESGGKPTGNQNVLPGPDKRETKPSTTSNPTPNPTPASNPTPAPTPAPAPKPRDPLEDLFGPTNVLDQPTSADGSSLPPLQPHEATEIFKRALFNTEGVLFQDSNLQIGYKSEYSKGMGRLMLYYGNTTTAALTDFKMNVSSPKYVNVTAQQMMPVIEPRAQAQQLITMNCVSGFDFTNHPQVQVSFRTNNGAPQNVTFRLPVSLCKFMEPTTSLNGPNFFNQWNQLPNAPQSEQVVIKSSKPVDTNALSRTLSSGFHFAILMGVDPNINNIVAAATVNAGTGQVACLLRIESNAQASAYRATIRSQSPQVVTAVKELLLLELS